MNETDQGIIKKKVIFHKLKGKKQKVIYNIEAVDQLPEDMPHFLVNL